MAKKSSFAEKIENKMTKTVSQIPYLNIFEEGEYVIRLLPIPNKPDEPAFEKYELHSKIYDPTYQKERQFLCLGPGCPFCKFADEFKKHYPKDAWRVIASPFYFWRVENKKTNAINLLKLSQPIQDNLISLILDMDRQGISLQDASDLGRDILITVTRVQTNNGSRTHYKFEALLAFESKPVSEKLLTELDMWEKVKPLAKMWKTYTLEEAKNILNDQVVKVPEDTKKKAMSKSSLAEEYKKKMNLDGIKDKTDEGNNE